MTEILDGFRNEIFSLERIEQAVAATSVYASLMSVIDIDRYDDPEIENYLIKRLIKEKKIKSTTEHKIKKEVLHIITEGYSNGGHTLLMENLAEMHDKKPDLLITKKIQTHAEERIQDKFKNIDKLTGRSIIDKINNAVMIISRYEKIVLHIHANDIITVIACGIIKRERAISVYFVNHADHAFTLGSSISDVYFLLSTYGQRMNAKKNILGEFSFLGIPIKKKKYASLNNTNIDKSLDISFFSAGSGFKYTPYRGDDIRPLINNILMEWPYSTFTIIGANPILHYWWWPIKLKFRSRLKILKALDYVEYNKVLSSADFYIDSHPFPGGTAFAEQMLAGRRCVGLTTKIQGYSPAEKTKKKTTNDVIESISNYDGNKLIDEIIFFNGFENVKNRYIDIIEKGIINKTDPKDYIPWQGDDNYTRFNGKSVIIPDSETLKYLLNHNKKIFIKFIMSLSLINGIYVIYKSIREQFSYEQH